MSRQRRGTVRAVTVDRGEIEDAFAEYQRRVRGGDWSSWSELFTEDAVYLEHEYGTFYGRDAIRNWIVETMDKATGMTFPVEWYVIDEDRVVWYTWNQFPQLPGRAASDFQFATISILRYGGGGRWRSQEDVYNAKESEAVLTDYLQAAAAAGVEFDGALQELLDEER
jgi:ketosteroid isomerase-like protein